MKTLNVVDRKKAWCGPSTWEERSGLLRFLSNVHREVERFNHQFGFDIRSVISPPAIDGEKGLIPGVGFVFVRYNRLLPEIRFCLYSVLKGRRLYGYIGIYRDEDIKTVKELKPITDYDKEGQAMLYEWLRELVRVSCEKVVL